MTCIGGYLKQVEEADANLPGTSSVRAVEKWLSTCQPSNLLNDTSAVGIHLVEASIVLTDGWLGAPTEDLLKVGLLQLATRAVGHLVSDPDSKWIDKTGQVYDLDEVSWPCTLDILTSKLTFGLFLKSEKQVAIGSLIHSFISPTPKPEFLKSAAGNFSVMGIIQPNSLWCQHYSLDIPLSHPWCKLVPTGQEQSICAMAAGHETCLHADDFFSATVMQQVKGQKLWLIAPPTPSNLKLWTSARTSGLHVPMDRLLNELEGLKVFMAAPGDIIMYPEGYLHACVTLECSIHCSFSMGSKVFLVSRAKEVERMLEWMEMCEVDAGVVQGILNSYPSFASGLSSTTDELDGLLGIRVHDRMKAVLQRQRGSASTLMSTSGPSSSSATPQLPAQGISKNRRKN
jgi:hypothetical protein